MYSISSLVYKNEHSEVAVRPQGGLQKTVIVFGTLLAAAGLGLGIYALCRGIKLQDICHFGSWSNLGVMGFSLAGGFAIDFLIGSIIKSVKKHASQTKVKTPEEPSAANEPQKQPEESKKELPENSTPVDEKIKTVEEQVEKTLDPEETAEPETMQTDTERSKREIQEKLKQIQAQIKTFEECIDTMNLTVAHKKNLIEENEELMVPSDQRWRNYPEGNKAEMDLKNEEKKKHEKRVEKLINENASTQDEINEVEKAIENTKKMKKSLEDELSHLLKEIESLTSSGESPV